MLVKDGRVISNFIVQGLLNKTITIFGDGFQTRSFCYVDDLIDGLEKLMNSYISGPINLGNPYEITILELAKFIRSKINPSSYIDKNSSQEGDNIKRKPLIELAKREIGWEPKTELDIGLENYFLF